MHILKSMAQTALGARALKDYRAVLVHGAIGAVINVQQPIKGEWHTVGSWYLSTLLKRPHDSISIDYGQDWNVTGGMLAIIAEAAIYCADNHCED
jgi:hypothetical protein